MVAFFDQPFFDLPGRDTFAQVRQLEFECH
jgi:hypothetical protein